MAANAALILGNVAEIFPLNYESYIVMRLIVGLSAPSLYQMSFLIGKFCSLYATVRDNHLESPFLCLTRYPHARARGTLPARNAPL